MLVVVGHGEDPKAAGNQEAAKGWAEVAEPGTRTGSDKAVATAGTEGSTWPGSAC